MASACPLLICLTNLLPSLKSCIYISGAQLFAAFPAFSPLSLLTLSINSLSTPRSHFSICRERMLHIFPTWSLVPRGLALTWLQLLAMAGRPLGRVTAMAWGTAGFSLREDTAGAQSEKPEKPLEPRWEWGHFLCKEIKVKRKIKVWFPASWFAFSTEIPFFLSEFAETTIGPLPVLVTMTPLTSSLGGVALSSSPPAGKLTAAARFCVDLQFDSKKDQHHPVRLLWKWQEAVYMFF